MKEKYLVHHFIDSCHIPHFINNIMPRTHQRSRSRQPAMWERTAAESERLSARRYLGRGQSFFDDGETPVKYSSLVWWYTAIIIAATTTFVLINTSMYEKKWIVYLVNVLHRNEDKVNVLSLTPSSLQKLAKLDVYIEYLRFYIPPSEKESVQKNIHGVYCFHPYVLSLTRSLHFWLFVQRLDTIYEGYHVS